MSSLPLISFGFQFGLYLYLEDFYVFMCTYYNRCNRLWWGSMASLALHCYQYYIQHISTQFSENLFCCCCFSDCHVIRFENLPLSAETHLTVYASNLSVCLLRFIYFPLVTVPLSIYVLSLPLPYLPEGTSLSPFFVLGSTILVIGLALYNLPQSPRKTSKSP